MQKQVSMIKKGHINNNYDKKKNKIDLLLNFPPYKVSTTRLATIKSLI